MPGLVRAPVLRLILYSISTVAWFKRLNEADEIAFRIFEHGETVPIDRLRRNDDRPAVNLDVLNEVVHVINLQIKRDALAPPWHSRLGLPDSTQQGTIRKRETNISKSRIVSVFLPAKNCFVKTDQPFLINRHNLKHNCRALVIHLELRPFLF